MKYCRSCGAELVDDAVICTKCGVPVDNQSTLKKNMYAIAGFILSLVAMVINGYGVPAVLGLVFSIVGLVQINKGGYKNRGLAIAGIVLGAIALVWDVLYYVVIGPALNAWLAGLMY